MPEYPDADVGVLTIHGIGSQIAGSTLNGIVDPLVLHLEEQARLEGAAQPMLGSVDAGEQSPTVLINTAAMNGLPEQCWLVREAHWADAFDAPGRIETVKWLGSIGPWFVFFFLVRLLRRFKTRWRREAIFGLAITAAVIGALVSAAYDRDGLVPWLFAVAVAIGLISLIHEQRTRRWAALVVALVVVIIYPVMAILTVGVVALTLISLLPLPGMEWLRKLQTALAGSIGDSYALIATQRRERAMRDTILRGVEALHASLPSGKPILLLAHSQGAALTYRLLRWDWPSILDGRRVTLLTFGSGVVPISVLEYRYRSTARRRLLTKALAFLGLVSMLSLAGLLARAATLGSTHWTLWLLVAAGLSVATYSVFRDALCIDAGGDPDFEPDADVGDDPDTDSPSKADKRIDDLETAARQASRAGDKGFAAKLDPDGCEGRFFIPGLNAHSGGLRWVDVWAAWDPVPNGPLMLSSGRAIDPMSPRRHGSLRPTWADSGVVLPESYMVANDHQMWTDHTTYRTNREDFVGRIAMEIAATSDDLNDGLSSMEHRLEAIPNTGPQLLNAAAEDGRKRRQHRGLLVFAMQMVAFIGGAIGVVMRHERLPELGSWLVGAVPDPIRSALSGIIDIVPDVIRDALAGGVRDSSHGYGLVAALAGIGIVMALQALIFRMWQGRATEHFTRSYSTQTRGWGIVGGLFVVLLALTPLAVGLAVDEGVERPETTINVTVSGVEVPATVTIQEIGAASDDALVVDVPVEGIAVRIFADSYVVTAVAPGAKDCVATQEEGEDTIAVACEPAATPLPTP